MKDKKSLIILRTHSLTLLESRINNGESKTIKKSKRNKINKKDIQESVKWRSFEIFEVTDHFKKTFPNASRQQSKLRWI